MTNIPYETIPIRENGEQLVDISEFGLVAEPVYYKQKYSRHSRQFMRRGVAERLREIEEGALSAHGFRFKIWDAWRPRSMQAALYDDYLKRLKTEHPEWNEAALHKAAGVFVTPADNPSRVPPHATGGSLDLTLIDSDGKEIDMGTSFDHFGPESHLSFFEEKNCDAKIRDNRRLLLAVLSEAGFGCDSDEWWHYDYGNQKWALKTGQPFAFYGEAVEDLSGSPVLAIKSDA